MNLIDFFDQGAARFGARDAFVQGDRRWRFDEMEAFSHRVAAALRRDGFHADSKCAILSANDVTAFGATLGILRAGCVWVPLNPRNVDDENAWILNAFDCELLIVQSGFSAFAHMAAERLPKLRKLLVIGDAPPGDMRLSSLDDWLAPVGTHFPAEPLAPDATALIVPTGGTTGRPKGVELSNRNMATFCANVLASFRFEGPPQCLAVAPLTHAAGIFAFPMMALGATHHIHAAVDPAAIARAIETDRIEFLFLPPTVIYAMLAAPDACDYDYSALRYFLYGAAPMSDAKLREAIDLFGPVMAQMFGQSEAPASITYLSPADHFDASGEICAQRLKSCGRPTPFVRAGVMDEEGRLLPAGEIGEIVVQGDLVMRGYYRNPEATAEASQFGWHHSGDLGYRDDEGFFYIVDRKKDLIISGGMNIFASEVEQALMRVETVKDCAVIGEPDPKWGEVVVAYVEARPGVTLDPDALRSHCRAVLGGVKCPKQIHIIGQLPRSSVGKVLKRTLRDAAWQGQDRRVS